MQLFYSEHISPEGIILDPDESRHCINVLRHKEGDEVFVTDGHGYQYQCRIEGASHKKTILSILNKQLIQDPYPHRLHLIVAPVKSTDRMEWMLEKAVEIGVSSIRFVNCQRSERKAVNVARMKKIAVSAMKQSLKYRLPELYELNSFDKIMKEELPGRRLVAWCETGKEDHILKARAAAKEFCLLIGPEGDFTGAEVNTAISKGFVPVSLGESRLRTETAAIVAIALLQSEPINT